MYYHPIRIQTVQCGLGCCQIQIVNNPIIRKYHYNKKSVSSYYRRKAGIFIFNAHEKRVLLVQSNGGKWGPPKGTLNIGENAIQGAIRELHEETDLVLSPNYLTSSFRVHAATYFHLPELTDEQIKHVFNRAYKIGDDATGVMWVRLSCLQEMVRAGLVDINAPCRKLIELNTSCEFDLSVDPPFEFLKERALEAPPC